MAGKTDCFPGCQPNLVRRPFHDAAAYVRRLTATRIAFGAALFLACIGVQTHAASTPKPAWRTSNEVWIAARADAVVGTGSQDNPYDGSTQARFDAAMMAIPSSSAIHLGPGTFVTKGIIPKSGWHLYLTPNTILRLDVLASIPGQKWAIFAGAPTPVSNIWIEGGLWDCNLQNQKIPLAAQAVSFISDEGNVTIKNIKVINWGSTLAGAECFVVGVFNVGRTGKIAHNIVLDGIEVTQPAAVVHRGTSTLIGAHGQDPINPKALSNGWLEKVDIKNCYVHDIDLPLMTASVGMGSWCHGVHIHHNRFENLGPKSDTLFGCYLDTGASEDVLVEENVFAGVVHGVWASLSTPDPVGNWTIRSNRFLINRNYSSGAVELRGVNTTIRNVLVEKNTIGSSTGSSLTAYGIALARVSDATVRDNTVDDINGHNEIVFQSAVTVCQVLNNHTRTGTLIRSRTVHHP
jgi:hypothetical protein